jgi:methyl-accepting chemotaxis protein
VQSFFKKILGISIIIIAITGMIFSAAGAVAVWTIRKSVITSLDGTVQNLITTLDAASDGLSIVDNSLNAASGTLIATAQTTETIAQTVAKFNTIANGIVGIVNIIEGEKEMPESNSSDLTEEIQTMTMNLNKATTSLDHADEVIDVYQTSVDNTINQLEVIRQSGPTWVAIFSVFLTVMLVWLALAQVGLFLHGFELVHKK